MGTITSGVGLISGLDIDGIVSQLIAIEGRPKVFIQTRNQVLQSQQIAYQDINARLLSLGLTAGSFAKSSLYDSTLSTSSDESVMTITSTTSAVPNNYAFTVDRLASAQQVITRGFVDSDTTALSTGSVTFEFGDGGLETNTRLAEFNNGAGVRRGKIQITDESGNSATIDLTKAITVNDVLDKINGATSIGVTATASDTGFKLTDTSSGGGTLTVTNATGSAGTSVDLGFDNLTEVSGVYSTGSVRELNSNTLLSSLNDGNGLRMRDGIGTNGIDFTFAFRDGSTGAAINIRPVANTDGTAAITVGDLMSQVSEQSKLGGAGAARASLTIVNGKFQFNDLTGGVANNFKVTTHVSSDLMQDMGHSKNISDGIPSSANYNPEGVFSGLNDRLLKNLKGGGHTFFMDITGNGDMTITSSDATVLTVKMGDTDSVRGAIEAINSATGNNGKIVASLNKAGNGIQLKDTTGTSGIAVASLNNSKAAWLLGLDTGLSSHTLLSELNSDTGIDFLSSGNDLDFVFKDGSTGSLAVTSSMQTVDDILSALTSGSFAGKMTAAVVGDHIQLTDTTIWDGSTVGSVSAAAGSGFAASFGLDGVNFDTGTAGSTVFATQSSFSDGVYDTGNLQLQYISGGTLLSSMNGGLGVASGRFVISDSTGATGTVDLQQGERTIQQVIDEINSRGLKVNARINDHGDGILIEDTNTGNASSKMKITESGSSTAKDLGILLEADTVGGDIDGSFEKTIKIDSVALVTGATLLSSLNTGDGIGVAGGDGFIVTQRDGTETTVDTSSLSSASTVNDFINLVNAVSNFTVTINAQGTKLDFTDDSTGGTTFKVTKLSGSGVTGDLGIAQTDTDGDGIITSKDLVELVTLEAFAQKINDAGIAVKATIVNDGSVAQPFRLSFTGTNLGSQGSFIFDDGGLGFGSTNLVDAEDAVVFYGSSDPTKALAITSSSNTLKKVIAGATIDLHTTSDQAVNVQISRDDVAVKDTVEAFVESFNSLVDTFDKYDKYDTETEERGLLLSDSTIGRLRLALYGIINSVNRDLDGSFNRLSQIGIRVDKDAKLKFDSGKFDAALTNDRDGVKDFFSYRKTERDDEGVLQLIESGMGVDISELLDRLTDSSTGVVERRMDNIGKIIALNEDRIEQIDVRLEQKEAKLRAEFLSMEKILAGLQNQSGSLASLANIASQVNSSN